MTKRSGLQCRQSKSKMPRLDITISSSQRVAAGPSRINSTHMQQPKPIQLEDMWGDDDDEEYIMLASQVVDKVDANAEMIISQSMNIRDADLSYGKFQCDVDASTQHQPAIEMQHDERSDILQNVPEMMVIDKANSVPQASTIANNTEQAKLEAHRTILAEILKTQKREIENLKETLNKVNEKCQTKEGEASTLRYELDLNKKSFEQLRKKQMSEISQLEKEYIEKIAKLEKRIDTQRSELEFKSIEIHHKKSKKSLNDSSICEQETLQLSEISSMFKIHVDHMRNQKKSDKAAVDFITSTSIEILRGLNDKDNEFQNNLHLLQSIYNETQTIGFTTFDGRTMKQIKYIATYLIGVLMNYVRQLELKPFNKYNPSAELKMISDNLINEMSNKDHLRGVGCQTISPRLIKSSICEKLIYELQMLAVIALLCNQHPCIPNRLLCEPISINKLPAADGVVSESECTFMTCIVTILSTIGSAKSVNSHKRFVESASILLVAIAKNYSQSKTNDAILLNVFKSIVFCAPDMNSLYHLSEFIEILSIRWTNNQCNEFCNNENNNVLHFQSYNINRFAQDTCPLQIFSCLLQVSFAQYESHSTFNEVSSQLALLTQITTRMMVFLRNCQKIGVDWILRKNASSENPQIPHCYCQLVSCIIVLLHFCMKSWSGDHKLIEFNFIETVFKMGTIFLYDITIKHFVANVLTIGGIPIKNRLQAIYDLIVSYQHLFSFDDLHTNAINMVNLRRIIWLNEVQMIDGPHQADSIRNSSIISSSFNGFDSI